MRLGLFVLFAALGAATAMALSPSNIVDEVSEASYRNLHTNLYVSAGMNRGFSAGSPTRYPANQHDAARDFIQASLTNAGLNVTLELFSFTALSATYTGACNVIATLPGTDTNAGYYMVGAHYDSVDTKNSYLVNSPGADDNASGTAAILELARVLGRRSFRSSIVFAAFDGEEKGKWGSTRYVSEFTTATSNANNGTFTQIYRGNIKRMISLDMIAYNPAGVNKAYILGGNPALSPLKTELIAAVAAYGGLAAYDGGKNDASDHGPFYNTTPSVDACVFIEYSYASNPYYHRAGDSTDSAGYIDYTFATRMTKAVAGYLAQRAQIVPTLQITATSPAASEWGPTPGEITVARDDTNGDLTVAYAIGGSATPDGDYVALPGTLIISNGCSHAVLTVAAVRDDLAEGPETVEITLLKCPDYGIRGSASAAVTIADVPVDDWRRTYFAGPDLTNAMISGDSADPDRNGIPNLMEYVLGRHPLMTNTTPAFTTSVSRVFEADYYMVFYDRRTNLPDATCRVMVNTNLLETNWLSGPAYVEETVMTTNEDPETVRARVLYPRADETDRIFLRLNVTRP